MAHNPASPLKQVRAHCLWCCNGSASEVAKCVSLCCPLWLLRFGRRPSAEEIEEHAEFGELHASSGAVLKAIRSRCIDCSGGSLGEVRSCSHESCSLHPFRMGRNPNIKPSAERKAELLARLGR